MVSASAVDRDKSILIVYDIDLLTVDICRPAVLIGNGRQEDLSLVKVTCKIGAAVLDIVECDLGCIDLRQHRPERLGIKVREAYVLVGILVRLGHDRDLDLFSGLEGSESYDLREEREITP